MRRRGGSHARGVSIDDKTGHKVLGRKLRQDGETGSWTTDVDQVHPQRFVRTPGPDGAHWRPGRGLEQPMGHEWIMKTAVWSPDRAQNYTQRPFLRVAVGGNGSIPLAAGGDGFAPGAAVNVAINPLTIEA